VRLSPDEIAEMNSIAKDCEINATALAGFFIRAALRAVREDGGRLKLPPNFALAEEPEESPFRMNEPVPPKPKKPHR